jgi:putative inorganic carbon (HCO3(-)) transporter
VGSPSAWVGPVAAPVRAARYGANLASALLHATLVAALALAPLEGYLQAVNGDLSKLAPALFLAAWALHRVFASRPLGVAHPVVWCAVALVPLVLVSAAVNLDNGFALIYTSRWLPFLILVVALVDVLTRDVHPWTALYALLTGAVLSAFGAILSFVALGDPRATGPLDDPNDLAYVLTAAVPIAVVGLGRNTTKVARVLLSLGLLLLLFGTAATLSRGGALALVAVLIWGMSRGLVRLKALTVGALVVVIIGMPALSSAAGQVSQALGQKQYIAQTNVDTRQLRWAAAARMLGDDPLLGVGPGGFRSHYVEYGRLAELDELDPVAHEMYLEVAAELGLPAFVVFLTMMLAAFVATEQVVRRPLGPVEDSTVLAALAAQGSLLAVSVSSVFLSQQYYMPLWAGLSVAAAVACRRTKES